MNKVLFNLQKLKKSTYENNIVTTNAINNCLSSNYTIIDAFNGTNNFIAKIGDWWINFSNGFYASQVKINYSPNTGTIKIIFTYSDNTTSEILNETAGNGTWYQK